MNPNSLADKKILITGATGFLGSHLADRLLTLGADVYGVSRNPGNHSDARVHWSQGEFSDIRCTRRTMNQIDPDVIFHLAGNVTALPAVDLVLPTLQSLLVSTVNILIVANEIRCDRVILAGSLTEPNGSSREPIPGSPYAAAKWAGTTYARMFHELYQTPVVIARPFMTYGPRQSRSKLVPHVIASLLKGESPRLSSGSWQADWIYIDDVIDGLVAAAQVSGIEGNIVELGSGSLVSVRDLVGHIVKLTNVAAYPSFGAVPDRPVEPVRAANISDAFNVLGWRPRISLDDGLIRTVDWYKLQVARW